MPNIVVSIIGPPGYAAGLGKKGTSTDLTLYNAKKGENTVTFIEPTRYPERLAPLFYATSLAQKAIVVVDELNSNFGECILMLQCSGVTSGYFVLTNYISRERIAPLIKGTKLEKFEFVQDDPNFLREELLKELEQTTITTLPNKSAGTVPVDHSFNVKGVGAVVLGIVADGTIKKHDTLAVLPGMKTAQIRSIQKHDDEFETAITGDRVGLALKNIDVADLERGTVLTTNANIKSTKNITSQACLLKFWQIPLKEGMILHLGHWMQFIPAKIETINATHDPLKPQVTLALEKELTHLSGDNAVITYLEGGKLRVTGTISLPS
jgi:selenocysteine-specific translation elongation factor